MKLKSPVTTRRLKLLPALMGGVTVAAGLLAADLTASSALLVVAHGSREARWNERVVKMVEQINYPGPKDVAFLTGKPPEHALPIVAAKLDQPGVRQIVVVPLLVSSFSGHYEEIRYFVGERPDLPHTEHDSAGHEAVAPLKTKATLRMTPAMDGHPLVSRILADEAKNLVKDAATESLILVAHGPNEETDNERWLEHLRTHARKLQAELGFRRVEALTLRDDAPKAVRDAATEQLRVMVRKAGEDSRVLVLPVLVSVGHMQQEIRKRLEGLPFTMVDGGVANHPLIGEWIVQQAGQHSGGTLSQRAGAER